LKDGKTILKKVVKNEKKVEKRKKLKNEKKSLKKVVKNEKS